MTYKEEIRDLFSVPDDYYLAHCISSDFGMGKGIVVEFNERFNMRNILLRDYGTACITAWDIKQKGHCIKACRVFNLITKRNYWLKPSYRTIKEALEEMKEICLQCNVTKIAMPKIGCGLDRLNWDKVSEIIKEVFEDTDVEILVCKQK